jgi:ribosome-associated protein
MTQSIDFELRGDHIALATLLKVTGLADSGGGAKVMVSSGRVHVDGQPELRKTRKICAGQTVVVGDSVIRVVEGAS